MSWSSPAIRLVREHQKISYSVVLILVLIVSYTFYVTYVAAATRTWDGGGVTNNWSDCDNWSSDTCPGSSDLAQFDGTSTKDATVDGSFSGSVDGVDINSGYTGTITQARDLTIFDQNYNQADGTWDQVTYDLFIDISRYKALPPSSTL